MRSAKVLAKAFRAGFHRTALRVCPLPFGSGDLVTRYRHFIAACAFPEVASCFGRSAVAGVEGLDGVGGADDPADLDVLGEERDEFLSGVVRQTRMIAG